MRSAHNFQNNIDIWNSKQTDEYFFIFNTPIFEKETWLKYLLTVKVYSIIKFLRIVHQVDAYIHIFTFETIIYGTTLFTNIALF